MPDRMRIAAAADAVAAAIAARDVQALRDMLARGFTHRTHGGQASDAETFLTGVAAIPGEILSVKLEDVRIDVTPTGVLVTGVQHAQVKLDGQIADDRRGFIDWFVESDGTWKIQAAVDVAL